MESHASIMCFNRDGNRALRKSDAVSKGVLVNSLECGRRWSLFHGAP